MRVLLMMVVVMLVGCATNKNKTSELPKEEKKVELAYIFLARGGCYGTCPIFDVTITKDGKVSYIGKQFVDNIGTFEGNLSTASTNALFGKAELLDWQSFPDKFPIDNVDLPQFRITVGNTSFVKKIKANSRADQEIIDLSIWMEEQVHALELTEVVK